MEPGVSFILSDAAITLQLITKAGQPFAFLVWFSYFTSYIYTAEKELQTYIFASSSFFFPVSFLMEAPRPSSKFFFTMLIVRLENTMTSRTIIPISLSLTI